MSDHVEEAKQFIEKTEHCSARHAGSRRVVEQFRGEMVYDGTVEAFDLFRHRDAIRCYAVPYTSRGKTEYATVLGTDEINSAEAAVRAVIEKERQKGSDRFASQEDQDDFIAYNGSLPAKE